MTKSKSDPVREDRIHNEAIGDAYGPEEQAMGWYYYLEGKIPFPFQAECTVAKVASPLLKGETSKLKAWLPRRLARATCSCSSAGKAGPWRSPCHNYKSSKGTKQPMKPSRTGITGWTQPTVSDPTPG